MTYYIQKLTKTIENRVNLVEPTYNGVSASTNIISYT